MLADGLYVIDYAAASPSPDLAGSALAALRDGKILGTDRRGAVFLGAYEYDRSADCSRVSLRLQVPPDGELITGYAAGAEGATIDIVGAIQAADGPQTLRVDVAGQPVEVRLTYVGALPS